MKPKQKEKTLENAYKKNEKEEKVSKLFFENHPMPTFLIKLNGIIGKANEAACKITGYKKEEIVGKRILEAPFLTEESKEKVREKLEKRLNGEKIEPYQLEIRTKDDRMRTLEIETQPLTEGERILGIFGTAKDVTEKIERRERDEFLHSLLSHDLRNKAQIIQGYHGLLKDLEIPEKGREYLEKADKGVRESIDLIEKVRSLRKVGEEELKEFEIGLLIDSIAKEYDTEGVTQEFTIETEKCDCTVLAGRLLKEVFLNLVENSINHSDGSKIKISCKERPGNCIVKVEDDGKGIADEDKEKIFERGFRKGDEAGTGLGLHIVKEIVESYGGFVEVKNSELGGARFDVNLEKVNQEEQ